MAARLDDLALFENDDAIRIFDGGEPVCNNNSRSIFCSFVKSSLNDSLAADVNGAGGFV